jgi:hypothetical protein
MSEVGLGHGEHGPSEGLNKKVALLISCLALFLAFSETLAKSAQTSAVSYNIEASNLWAFFQAKTIRMTTVRTAAEAFEVQALAAPNRQVKEAYENRIDSWKKAAARYDSEPETKEVAEQKHEGALAAYHWYELASAALQIAIVLASAGIITGTIALPWISGALGVVGIAFCLIGLLAPQAMHLF